MGIYNLQWDEIYYLQSTDNEQKRPISENVKQLFPPYVCVIEVSVCQFDSYVGVSLSVWCKGQHHITTVLNGICCWDIYTKQGDQTIR